MFRFLFFRRFDSREIRAIDTLIHRYRSDCNSFGNFANDADYFNEFYEHQEANPHTAPPLPGTIYEPQAAITMREPSVSTLDQQPGGRRRAESVDSRSNDDYNDAFVDPQYPQYGQYQTQPYSHVSDVSPPISPLSYASEVKTDPFASTTTLPAGAPNGNTT